LAIFLCYLSSENESSDELILNLLCMMSYGGKVTWLTHVKMSYEVFFLYRYHGLQMRKAWQLIRIQMYK